MRVKRHRPQAGAHLVLEAGHVLPQAHQGALRAHLVAAPHRAPIGMGGGAKAHGLHAHAVVVGVFPVAFVNGEADQAGGRQGKEGREESFSHAAHSGGMVQRAELKAFTPFLQGRPHYRASSAWRSFLSFSRWRAMI